MRSHIVLMPWRGDSLSCVPAVEVTLIGKPDCHLCDEARRVVAGVIAALGADRVALVERSILEEPELYAAHWEEIPVVLIDGQRHTFWRVDPERLRKALEARL